MSNGDWSTPGTTITLPPGAGPDDPALVQGDVTIAPPELVAFYTARAETIIALTLYRLNATRFDYQALIVDPDPALVTGVASGGLVLELSREYMFVGQGRFEISSGIFRIMAAAEMEIQSGADLKIDTISQGRGEIGASYGTAGTLVTCVGPQIAMPTYGPGPGGLNTIFTFKAGRLYQIDISYSLTYTAGGTVSIVTLRKGLNTIVGQALGAVLADYNGTNFGFGIAAYATFYVKNATAAAITTDLGLTVQRSAGAANIGLYGDAQRPLIVRVRDITDTAPALNGVAVALV